MTETLKKKLEGTGGAAAKKWHLKLGIAQFFLGHTADAAENLRQSEGALAGFYLAGRWCRCTSWMRPSRRSTRRKRPATPRARYSFSGPASIAKGASCKRPIPSSRSSRSSQAHNSEYHFQLGACDLAEGNKGEAVRHFERAVELDPGHSAALFQLGHINDQAGNDDDAIDFYERCLNQPPIHVGALNNLGVLYEDHEKYDKAADCYHRILSSTPTDERARLFLKDAQARKTMHYSPEEELAHVAASARCWKSR